MHGHGHTGGLIVGVGVGGAGGGPDLVLPSVNPGDPGVWSNVGPLETGLATYVVMLGGGGPGGTLGGLPLGGGGPGGLLGGTGGGLPGGCRSYISKICRQRGPRIGKFSHS